MRRPCQEKSVQDLKHWMAAQEVSRFSFWSIREFIRHTLPRSRHTHTHLMFPIFEKTPPWEAVSHIVISGHRCWGGTKSQQGSQRSLWRDCQVLLGLAVEILTGRVSRRTRITLSHYFQTLNSISAEKNSTVIFPLPIDLITNILHGDKEDDKESSSLKLILAEKRSNNCNIDDLLYRDKWFQTTHSQEKDV